ncbi:hypothetical protein Tco_1201547 [Tanacetum coccineum]
MVKFSQEDANLKLYKEVYISLDNICFKITRNKTVLDTLSKVIKFIKFNSKVQLLNLAFNSYETLQNIMINIVKLLNKSNLEIYSAKDKTGLSYDSQVNESEVVHSVFNSRESDVDDSPVNVIFKIGEGFHAVPPPYTGNYMPLRRSGDLTYPLHS